MSYQTIQNIAFFGMLGAATFFFIYLLHPFVQPLVWAIILGIVFYPWYQRIQQTITNNSAAAALTIALLLVVFFVPLYFVGSLVVKEAIALYQNLNTTTLTTEMATRIADTAYSFGWQLDIFALEAKLAGAVEALAGALAGALVSAGKATTHFVVLFLLMLYILFFVFRDGAAFLKKLQHLLPLGSKREEELFARFTAIIRAIFKGTLVIAFLQGLLGALILAVVGASNIALWGAVMMIFAVIPALGPAVVLFPFALWLLLQGNIVAAAIVLVGIAIVSVTDNILRPILVGKQTHMHDLIIMLSILGGLALWGASGFVLGPVLAGLTITLWEMFELRYQKELDED